MIDASIVQKLKEETEKIRAYLKQQGKLEEKPKLPKEEKIEGEATATAYPILGLEKYLGMSDSELRLAYFPSVSVCHKVMQTITYVKFDRRLEDDLFIVNGKQIDKSLTRASKVIRCFRNDTGIKTKVLIASRNRFQNGSDAKGLGTSAAAGAALAKAIISAAYGEEMSRKSRLVSTYARLFAGSASRSAAGGVALWFSYEGIAPEESYSVRIDDGELPLKMVVVPLPLGITTEEMHRRALSSPFYEKWATNKAQHVFELVNHVENRDVFKIGEMAESDTRFFHSLLLQCGALVWMPETVSIIHLVSKLREAHFPVHYSIDTGPSVFIITDNKHADRVRTEVSTALENRCPTVISEIGGPPETASEKDRSLLLDDIKHLDKM
jgi:diphosphomevalonate decarboxylase